MSLGRRRHALDAVPYGTHGPLQNPARYGQQGLHRDIELAAKTATTSRGDDAHALLCKAKHPRHLVPVHVGRLRAGKDLHALADATGIARLGLDIGVLDKTGLEAAFSHMSGNENGLIGIAFLHEAARQHIIRFEIMQRRISNQPLSNPDGRGLDLPGDWQISDCHGVDAVRLAHQRQDRFAAIANLTIGQHGLILEIGIDAEGILARHIMRCQNPDDAGMRRLKSRQITQREARPRMGRADNAQPQGVSGCGIRTKKRRAIDARCAVEFHKARADAGSISVHVSRRHGSHIQYGFDDCEIARAAAEHTAQRILHSGTIWRRIAGQQIHRRHDHAGRADAALCRAVTGETLLQSDAKSALANTLDGLDALARDLRDRHQTGAGLLAIDAHRAGPAIARIAADLGSGEAEMLAQHHAQACRCRHSHMVHDAVDMERDGHDARLLLKVHAARSCRVQRSASARLTRIRTACRR